MKLSISLGKKNPMRLITIERNTASITACAATSAAPTKFFSPVRLATIAVTPIASPQATEYKMVSEPSVSITVEVAAVPT